MLREMDGARAIGTAAPGGGLPALRDYALRRVELPPITPGELRAWFRSGAPGLEDCERILAWAARGRGAVDVGLAEGLARLCEGDRLAALGCHLDDYAREVLDLGRRAALELVRLGRGLRSRPLLREALRTGRVRLRAAQTVLAVAIGADEADWVELAAQLTVRELEQAVRSERAGTQDDDEAWLRLHVALEPDDRAVVDEALAVAGEVIPGTSRMERLEALAQEFLAEVATDADEDDRRRLWPAFRGAGPGERARRAAALEAETERWCVLPAVRDWTAPDVAFDDAMSADEVDAQLRELAAVRAGWDDFVGTCAYLVKESGLCQEAGFADFRHYLEERLGLPARAIEQRVAVERRLATSPALREARRQQLPFEKLRLLARLPERETARWTPRAHAMTCVQLSRALDRERERQLRARRKLSVPLPRRIAVVLAAAIAAIRERLSRPISSGKCLAVLACHFLETWSDSAHPRRTRSRQVRERDEGHCQVPGCSHAATHAHHVEFRSHGGGDAPENLVGLCAFHHLRCVHGGWLRVTGQAPDGLTWFLRGKAWTGPRSAPERSSAGSAVGANPRGT
jgi:hypothetical protein